jgi:hypothetical protein
VGSRRFSDLIGMRPPGHSRPIGRTLRRRQLTATLSFLNSKYEVQFGDEIDIEEEFGWRQLPPETEGGGEFRVWVGFEVQTRDRSLRDCTLVIATYPYSTDWFDWGDFKPILRRGRNERFQPLRAPQERIKELFRSRAKLSTDNLESRPGRLTARLSLPTRTEGLAITARGRSQERSLWTTVEASLNRRRGGKYPSDFWCFGACREFEKCCAVLRMSPTAFRMLEATEDGTLFKDRPSKDGTPALQLGPTARRLKENVLESSIVKALAGSSPKLDKIQEKPVMAALLMEWIYKDTMYSLAQRLRGEPEAGGRVHPEDLAAFADTSNPPDDPSFNDMADRFRAALRERGLTEDFRHVIENRLRGEDDQERITACAALVGAHKARYRPHRTFEPLLQRIAGDPANSAAVRQAARMVLDLMRGSGPPAD